MISIYQRCVVFTAALFGLSFACFAQTLVWERVAEFYDPRTSTGIEGAAASMINGKLYVSHGHRAGESALLSVYDPETSAWTHRDPSANLGKKEGGGGIAFGRHYAFGSYNRFVCEPQPCGPALTHHLEEYDPVLDRWRTREPMSVPRGKLGGASWDGKIYAVGGIRLNDREYSDVLEEYDPLTDIWTVKTPMPVAVAENTATIAAYGYLFVFGGLLRGATVTNLIQVYDIANDQWYSWIDPIFPARTIAMAGLIRDQIAVFGGVDNDRENLRDTWLFDLNTFTFSQGPDMVEASSEHAQGVTYWPNDYGDKPGSKIVPTVYAVGSGPGGVARRVVQRLTFSFP